MGGYAMKKLLLVSVLIITISMIFTTCTQKQREELFGTSNCQEEMDDCIAAHGNPEEINKYDSGDYHSWTFGIGAKVFQSTLRGVQMFMVARQVHILFHLFVLSRILIGQLITGIFTFQFR